MNTPTPNIRMPQNSKKNRAHKHCNLFLEEKCLDENMQGREGVEDERDCGGCVAY